MVNITIRDVAPAVRDRLAQQAAAAGQSLQAYLHGHLEQVAARPTPQEWARQARLAAQEHGTELSSGAIVALVHDARP